MKPTEVLMSEHRGIERMLAVAERGADALDAGRKVSPQVFLDIVDFLRNFADKCHHGKEETQLFPAMEKAGVPGQGGPIGVMLMEHEQGRAFIRAMSAAAEKYAQGDAAAARPLTAAVHGYAHLLHSHIYKEDNILFPMADSVLAATEGTRLTAAFENIEATVMGPGVHERYHAMIDTMDVQSASW